MDRKIVMGVAAVAGIGLLLYMRKSGEQSTIAGSGALVGAASSAANWAAAPIVINASTKPLNVTDRVAASQAPPPPAPPAASPASNGSGGAVWGASGSSAAFTGIKDGRRTYADGSSEVLGANELDLYNRGILGAHYGAYTTAPKPSAPSGGAVWGAS